MSKIVTAWAALALVDQGRPELDEPVDRHLRRWELPASAPGSSGVTLRRLLSHTAGLPSGASTPLPNLDVVPSIVDVVAGRGGTPAAVPDAPPGTRFRYSNPGYALTQLLIEDLTDTPFAEWVDQRVLVPLNMTSSTFNPTLTDHDAAPHQRSHRRLPDGYFNQLAAGGLHTTAVDLIRLANAMTAVHPSGLGASLLSSDLIEEMWNVPAAAAGAYRLRSGGYGLGQVAGRLPSGTRFFANQGSRPGWRSLLICLPDEGHALAVTTNSNTGLPLLVHVALRWLRHQHHQPRLHRLVRIR